MRLILIRGLPGSGKSTYAKQLAERSSLTQHYENDQYFTDNRGHYHYKPDEIEDAAHACWRRTARWLLDGYVGSDNRRKAVVSNTFVTKPQVMPYIHLGIQTETDIKLIVCDGNYQSVHNVPEETLQQMKEAWQDFTLEELMKDAGCKTKQASDTGDSFEDFRYPDTWFCN